MLKHAISAIALTLVLPLSACNKSSAQPGKAAETPPAEPAAAPAPPPTPKKLAEVGTFELMDAVKAAGWEPGSAGTMVQGAWSAKNLGATKGDLKATFQFVAPSGQPADKDSTLQVMGPKEAAAAAEQKGAAVLLRDDALLSVEIAGQGPEASKALLAAVVANLPLTAAR